MRRVMTYVRRFYKTDKRSTDTITPPELESMRGNAAGMSFGK